MKRKIAVFLLVFAVVGSFVSTAFAYSVPSDTIVYVTPTGECYHLRNCSYIQGSSTSVYVSVAVSNGYRACSRCDPDVMVGSYGDSYVYKHPSTVIAESKKEAAAQQGSSWWRDTLEFLWALICVVANMFIAPIIVGLPIILIGKAVKAIKKKASTNDQRREDNQQNS